jgi:hypothetical protein
MDFDGAVDELYARRKARETFADYCRYLTPEEVPAKHHELICRYVDKVVEGEIRNLLVFAPPGSAKSTYSTKKFPAYYLGRLPKSSIICASYDTDLATEFGRQVRNYVGSDRYQAVFTGTKLSEDSRSKGQWATDAGGFYYATGVGSAIKGRSAKLGEIDDPVKGQAEADSKSVQENTWKWYISDFSTRLVPNSSQIIIQTRWSENDLSGRILPDWDGGSGFYEGFDGQQWFVLCLPAEARENDILGRDVGEWLWDDYYTPEEWATIKNRVTNKGTYWRVWNALYQQDPQPDEGDFFKREWFEAHRYDLGKHPAIIAYGAGDYAVTKDGGDYTELGIGGFDSDYHLWLTDWWGGQVDPLDWMTAQLSMIKRHNILHWTSEQGVIRRSVESTINARKKESIRNRTGRNFTMHWLAHIGDKAAKARGFQMMAMAGEVHIPRCKWGDELIDQLVSFIPGANLRDDKVDVCGFFGRILDQVYGPTVVAQEKEREVDPYGFEEQEEISWKTM